MSEEKTFTLGLTMAGAVSAGAYNAGVLDFLVQALEEWERAKEVGHEDIPNHRVVIPVMTGTSAGGVVASLGILALNAEVKLPPGGGRGDAHVLPDLHAAWVDRISMLPERDGDAFLLGSRDLGERGRLVSILDGTVIDTVSEDIRAGLKPSHKPRAYFAEPLHLFLTLTNLRGVPLFVPFAPAARADADSVTASDGHYMMMHADRAHYAWSGVGTSPFESRWLADYGDQGTRVDLETFQDEAAWSRFKAATLGTAAFPVGLPGRLIEAHTSDYAHIAWPYPLGDGISRIAPKWPEKNPREKTVYPAIYGASDGGIIDNEPFEIARWTIMKTPGEKNDPDAKSADRAVIMVDPFPAGPAFDPNMDPAEVNDQVLLGSVLKALFPALKNQARVKAVDLARAAAGSVHSRFLVAPRRLEHDGSDRDARYAIACSTFGAFGGFLSRGFRQHDFQLGRRNCQHFLRRWFTLHEDNPLFDDWPDAAKSNPDFHTGGPRPDGGGGSHRVVIPLLGSAAEEVARPEWPSVGQAETDAFRRHVTTRADAVKKALAADIPERFTKLLANLGWRVKRGSVVDLVLRLLEADLVRRDLHAAWRGRLDDDLERGVMAALMSTGPGIWHSPRTLARGISRENLSVPGSRPVTERDVADALGAARLAPLVTARPAADGTRAYALLSRRPPAWKRFPVIRDIAEWWSPPKFR